MKEADLFAVVLFSDAARQGEKRLLKTDTDKPRAEKDLERLS